MPDNLAQLKADMNAALRHWNRDFEARRFAAWHVYLAARQDFHDLDKLWGMLSREAYLSKFDELSHIAGAAHAKYEAIDNEKKQAFREFQAIEAKYKSAKAEAERQELYDRLIAR